ncbi:MAG: response regulator [Gammaproteobacteria bacterium]|nr:response regulator [Gammaproteobacteria bacterium]
MDKAAKNTTSEILFLYELSLSIGRSMDVAQSCQDFLGILMSRKEIAFAAVWVANDKLPGGRNVSEATLVCAVPQSRVLHRSLLLEHPSFRLTKEQCPVAVKAGDPEFSEVTAEQVGDTGVIALFSLGGFGLLKLYSQRPEAFSGRELRQLRNVVEKFAISLEGCLAHQCLYAEVLERRQAQEALKQSEGLLEAIVENIPDMIFLKDADELRFLRLNKAGEELLGYSRAELFGKDDYDLFPKEEAEFFISKDREILVIGKPQDIPHGEIQTRYHGKHIVHTKKIPIMDRQGKPKYLLGIAEDITEFKKAEVEHERLQRELQQAQKMGALGQLTGGIAHDFNNLLGIISGYTGLALDNCVDKGEEKLSGYLRHVQNAAGRATTLVSQMLAFSRNEKVEDQPLHFQTMLEENTRLLRSTLPTSINITTNIEVGLPAVLMNATQLSQLIMNLSINARDAMNGQGTLAISLGRVKKQNTECTACHGSIKGAWVALSVTDTGSGIDPKAINNIFDPFFTTKDVGKGSGLGLAVIYGIMHSREGHIQVETKVGKGTRFQLLFPPYIDEETAQTPEASQSAANHLPQGAGEHILVVDDEPALGEYLSDLLKFHGYQVTVMTDSREALGLFKVNPDKIDLVVTDQTMPGMTGVELIIQFRKIRLRLPVILCTGFSTAVNKEVAAEMKFHYLEKPVNSTNLVHAVKAMLNDRKCGTAVADN